jgi:hypothetical protein
VDEPFLYGWGKWEDFFEYGFWFGDILKRIWKIKKSSKSFNRNNGIRLEFDRLWFIAWVGDWDKEIVNIIIRGNFYERIGLIRKYY